MSQKIKKICFFNSDPKWGGGVTFYKDHTLGTEKLGYEVIGVTSPNSLLAKWYDKTGIENWAIPVGRLSFLNPITLFRLVLFYRRESVDAVIFTNSEDLKAGGLAAKLAKVPKIIYRRGLAVPIKNRLTNRYIFKNVLTHIFANSEETKRTILQNLKDYIDGDRIEVIYNGVDTSKHIQSPYNPLFVEPDSEDAKIVIGNAGRLSAEKGQSQLISIANTLRSRGLKFIILIAGNGDMHNALSQLIDSNDLGEYVRLVGYIEDIDRFMQSIDIFALTSHWEGFGYVMVEAMLHKKPVVAFDVSSIPEVVTQNETGLLARYTDIKDFSDQIEFLIKNADKRRELGTTGYESAQNRFDIHNQILKFVDFLES